MTLDEAIKHCDEVAEKNETKGKMIQNNFSKLRREQKQEIDYCLECASEHRQLAEWLLELKKYQRGIERIKELRDGFNQIPLSLEASVLESALELLGEEGEPQKNEENDTMTRDQLANFIEATKGQWTFRTKSGCEIKGEEIEKKIIESLRNSKPSRPRGKWIHWTDDYKDYVTCSCCEYGEEGEVLLSDKTPFCPICGADMREGAE